MRAARLGATRRKWIHENAFQPLVEQILDGLTTLANKNAHAISQFHALWRLRAEAKKSPSADQPLNGLLPGKGWTKDEQEILESKHFAYTCNGTNIPGRQITGQRIQFYIGQLCRRPIAWGIIRAKQGEFVVPGTFGTLPIVPLPPSVCLIGGTPNAEISKKKLLK